MKLEELFEELKQNDIKAILSAIDFDLNMIDNDMGEDPELEDVQKKLTKKGIDSLDADERSKVRDSVIAAIDHYGEETYYKDERDELKKLVQYI